MSIFDQPHLHRRQLLAGGLGLVAATTLSACGAGAAQSDGKTRPIKTVKGTVKVPVKPKSIVCLEQYSTFNMYDFKVKPAATIEDVGTWAYGPYKKKYENTPKVGTWEGDIDAIAAKEPDLIFGLQAFHDKIYDELKGLAPTVLHKSDMDGLIPWKEVSELVAHTLSVDSTHDKLRNEYHDAVDKVKRDHADALAELKISLVSGIEGKWLINYPRSWCGVIIEDLGGTWGSATKGHKENSEEMSYEQLDVLSDSDLIFYLAMGDGSIDAPTKTLLKQPAFKSLAPVKDDHAFPLANFYVFHYKQAVDVVTQIGDVLAKL